MSIENYKEKARENLETAEWSEKKKYFDVAMSRYYYCEYQKIIYISKKLNFYVNPKKGEDSHKITIKNFVSSEKCKLSNEEKIDILKMHRLRRYRNDAEYKEYRMEANDYHLSFKYFLNNIKDITDSMVKGK